MHSSDQSHGGPVPIRDVLPKLRLRVRTIPVPVWRNGHWQVEWIVLSYHELENHDGVRLPIRNIIRRSQS
jgi:hypothetical protein